MKAYFGFELPGKINKVRRVAFDYGRANISGCKAMLCPMRDIFWQCGKRKTTHAQPSIQLVMISLS
jgi:hypothetical protein